MKNATKYLFLIGILGFTAAPHAHMVSYESPPWQSYDNDPATGPDEGTAEWEHCRARGGCQ